MICSIVLIFAASLLLTSAHRLHHTLIIASIFYTYNPFSPIHITNICIFLHPFFHNRKASRNKFCSMKNFCLRFIPRYFFIHPSDDGQHFLITLRLPSNFYYGLAILSSAPINLCCPTQRPQTYTFLTYTLSLSAVNFP